MLGKPAVFLAVPPGRVKAGGLPFRPVFASAR